MVHDEFSQQIIPNFFGEQISVTACLAEGFSFSFLKAFCPANNKWTRKTQGKNEK